MNWMLLLFVGFSWASKSQQNKMYLNQYLCKEDNILLVADKFNGIISVQNWIPTGNVAEKILFLEKNSADNVANRCKSPQIKTKDGAQLLYLSKWHIRQNFHLYTVQAPCNATEDPKDFNCTINHTTTGSCQIRDFNPGTICKQTYKPDYCNKMEVNNKYIINITNKEKICFNCNNPVKKPKKTFNRNDLKDLNVTFEIQEGEELNPAQAAGIMGKMRDIAALINDSSAELALGEGVMGVLVRETEPMEVDEVSFAYVAPNDSISIIASRERLDSYSRSVTVTKEALEKAVSLNVTVPFAAVFRFLNMVKDEEKSTVLGNEVLAIEMGTMITNLTDPVKINFLNTEYEGIPSCRSWNGEGSQPNWTDDGCLTINKGGNITCQCSHLTFFAVLLVPLNETISSSDLNKLTIITQFGCGLSMFFLSIILFMHVLVRKTKASKATRILIHLVSAMFLLNFAFLINNFVAKLQNPVGCKIMAALMHYFMLVTFTWFAVQAFHLCLQLYTGGKIVIRHYILKVSITSWVLPSVVGIVLLSVGKYGEQVIYTNDSDDNVAMCWITDGDVHYIVNIGYYMLVFLFTFTTFIVTVSWLFCLSRTKSANTEFDRSGKRFVTILGLCCMLGITWGCAFFAYGDFRIPAYYIFTVLNSFQGFFLFIYYYNTRDSPEIQEGVKGHNTSDNTSTSVVSQSEMVNPYINVPAKK